MSNTNSVQPVSIGTTPVSNSRPPIFSISNDSGLDFTLRAPRQVSQLTPGQNSTFTIAKGYHLTLYPQANFAGTPAEVNGPVTAPLNLADDNHSISLAVKPINYDSDSGSGWTWFLVLLVIVAILVLLYIFNNRRQARVDYARTY